jgi:hypothetical protein
MLTSKLLRITMVVLFVLGVVIFASSVSAEMMKWTGTSFPTDWQPVEVGDQEGHVMGISKMKYLWVNSKTGERALGSSVNMMDINPKAMKATLQGYGDTIDKDGDKIMRSHEGKMVGPGHWSGTWVYTSGTGKYEGIKGSGKWDSYPMGPGEPSYLETEGDVEMPAK